MVTPKKEGKKGKEREVEERGRKKRSDSSLFADRRVWGINGKGKLPQCGKIQRARFLKHFCK